MSDLHVCKRLLLSYPNGFFIFLLFSCGNLILQVFLTLSQFFYSQQEQYMQQQLEQQKIYELQQQLAAQQQQLAEQQAQYQQLFLQQQQQQQQLHNQQKLEQHQTPQPTVEESKVQVQQHVYHWVGMVLVYLNLVLLAPIFY